MYYIRFRLHYTFQLNIYAKNIYFSTDIFVCSLYYVKSVLIIKYYGSVVLDLQIVGS